MVKIRRKKSYAQLISHARFYTKVCLLQQEKKGLYFLEVEVIWIESFLCRGSELFSFVICLLFDYRISIRILDNINVLFSDEQYFHK